MLFLLMQLDGDRYALDIAQVAEVLPLVKLTTVPRAPVGVAGFVDYGGAPVPVIDLSQLLANRPAHRRLNTRLVMVHYRPGDRTHLLGLIAERATETMRRDPAEFQDSGVKSATPPHLGRVVLDPAGPVHWIDVATLMPELLTESLFQKAVNA
jgi:chemotaxis-related protein WspB